MKHKIIVTNIPAFYKINLYNEVNKSIKLTVVYTEANESDRNGDFVNGEMAFDNYFLHGSFCSKLKQLMNILRQEPYEELILGYWDSLLLILLAFLSPKRKNSFIVESSYLESNTKGVKGLIKRLFISRLTKVYASGRSQRKITDDLGFDGETIITKGVGVFNYIQQPDYEARQEVKNFLYVGRFVEVKNLRFLITVFNDLPQYTLHLAGFGEQEDELKTIAKENVHFLGAIDNKKLSAIYQSMDVFVLPSKIEPWGLVVEEALNNGLPVLLSDRVGSVEEIINEGNGVIFHYNSEDELCKSISQLSDITFYNSLRKNIAKMNFEEIEKKQIECYI